MCGCNVCHYMIDVYYLWYGNYVYLTIAQLELIGNHPRYLLGIVTMVCRCSNIQALHTD